MILPLLAAAVAGGKSGPILPMDAQHIPTTDAWLLPVSNSMFFTWIIVLVMIVVVRLGTRKMELVPTGLQNFIEAIIEGMHNFLGSMLEPKVVRWAFPFICSFFLFILISNYFALMPGVGSIGWGELADEGLPRQLKHVDIALFRPPTADANMTIAMALVFFVMNLYWAVRYNSLGGLVHHIFGVKGGMKGIIALLLAPVFLAAGFIEVISILIRPVALAMRLYGNIYGGETVLTTMLSMAAGAAAFPFYFLELIVATVQALVFTILCIAFTAVLCSHSEDHAH